MKLLTGGGPNVAANVQAGKTNSQTLGTTRITEQKTNNGDIQSVEAKVSAEEVEKVVVNEVQPWVVLLLILGWLLPSPNEIGRWITNLFKRKKDAQ
jgi:cell division inhibitor SulA